MKKIAIILVLVTIVTLQATKLEVFLTNLAQASSSMVKELNNHHAIAAIAQELKPELSILCPKRVAAHLDTILSDRTKLSIVQQIIALTE